MSKILYMSCHEVLEFEEVSLFSELGYEVFSPGAYVCNENKGDQDLRPSIPGLKYNPDIVEKWHQDIALKHPGEDGKDHLTKEFVDEFDMVVVMHLPRWISRNWEAIKHKRVIWRTIGQSIASTEAQLRQYRNEGMEIVRYSPREVYIPGFIGQDAMIRFYKDPEQFKDWNGQKKQVINFSQDMINRNEACNFTFFEQVTSPFPRRLFGTGSEKLSWGAGKITYQQLQQEMRDNRCYFYTGTHPASYTLNFMEALMTGIPMVAIGPQHGNASYFPGHPLYEIPDLIENNLNGFISDDINELRAYINLLLTNDDLAKDISIEGRKIAIEHFGKEMIGLAWKEYLDG
jgi:glycosyltransferase involved in cell wall biosynthesis